MRGMCRSALINAAMSMQNIGVRFGSTLLAVSMAAGLIAACSPRPEPKGLYTAQGGRAQGSPQPGGAATGTPQPVAAGLSQQTAQPREFFGTGMPPQGRTADGTNRAAPVREFEQANGTIAFNYAGVELREVARDILGTGLGFNYTVDPRAQAAITAQTAPLPRDAVLPVFESILRTSGLALVETDGLYRIIPLEDAARTAAARGRERAGYGVRVIPLQSVQAAELKSVLDPFVPAGGVLQVDPRRNILVVSGPATALNDFADLANELDVDWLASRSFGIYPLKVGSAEDIAAELGLILEEGDGGGPLAGLVRVVPVERLNAVLVIASQPSQLRQVRAWIERLDYGDDQTTPRIFEYYVQNSRATDLARVLSELLTSSNVVTTGGETAPGTTSGEIGSSDFSLSATGTGGANGPAGGPRESLADGTAPDTAQASGPAARIAESRQRERSGFGDDQQRRGGGGRGGQDDALDMPAVRIVADEKTNALVILARPRDYPIVESIIRKLDIVPMQVLIESTIAEVTLNDELRYGIQYYLREGNHQFQLSQGETGPIGPTGIGAVFPGFNYVLTTSDAVGVISLLDSVSDVNVISSPQLMVLDHQTAALQVGDQVPVVTQSAQSVVNPDSPIVNSIDYRNTGVVLQVTPRVNANGLVTLEIDQEVSDVARTTSSTINSPTISQRRIVSSIIVQDGETIALGGLIRQNETNGRSGIPLLSDLPIMGPLFRTTTKATARTELLILLRPKVIRNTTDARTVTQELRDRMRAIKPLE
ncbi:type II secretion system secretin GspD [Indioceanicola profundi]|uniref:type II secretion system secretin GspD n=1 Tax=Indioceanicola profundi TaxID=2220096 RepID=UPI000E6AA312|nr:type II secretion system secretin GspD [Indioceanicola profundi]